MHLEHIGSAAGRGVTRIAVLLVILGSVGFETCGLACCQAVAPQPPTWQVAAGGHAEFDVASIHPAEPGNYVQPNMTLNSEDTPVPPGGLFVADFPLMIFIEFAYKIMPTHEQEEAMVAHLPHWVVSDRYLIQAKFSGNPNKDQIRLMMQSLLAERFGLTVHFENRDAPVFALVADREGKLGPRIRPHDEGPACDKAPQIPKGRTSPSVPPGGFVAKCGQVHGIDGPNHTLLIGGRDITLDHLAGYLTDFEDPGRPIVDETGLSGSYDFSLDWLPDHPETAQGGGRPADAEGPSFFDALKEQLGLRLKPTRAAVPTLAIDHIEPLTPN
jgi:bla regulator protein blaR1